MVSSFIVKGDKKINGNLETASVTSVKLTTYLIWFLRFFRRLRFCIILLTARILHRDRIFLTGTNAGLLSAARQIITFLRDGISLDVE